MTVVLKRLLLYYWRWLRCVVVRLSRSSINVNNLSSDILLLEQYGTPLINDIL
jgi:hypothetical protein